MAVIIEHAPVMFQCNRCPWAGPSFAEMADHAWNAHPVNRATGDDEPIDAPTVPLDLTHRPARPLVSRAKRRPAGEVELAASEGVGDVGRKVKGITK